MSSAPPVTTSTQRPTVYSYAVCFLVTEASPNHSILACSHHVPLAGKHLPMVPRASQAGGTPQTQEQRVNQRTQCLVEGSEQAAGTGPKGYNPELPVLQCGGVDILVEHAAHLIEALACDGHPCGWQLLLAEAVGHKQCCRSVFRRLGATGATPWGEALAGPQLSARVGRQCPPPRAAVRHGPMLWSHTALPFEHHPSPRQDLRGDRVRCRSWEVLRRPVVSCCLPSAAACPAWLP